MEATLTSIARDTAAKEVKKVDDVARAGMKMGCYDLSDHQ